MSSRMAKKIRRQVKQTMREDYVSTLFWLKRLQSNDRRRP